MNRKGLMLVFGATFLIASYFALPPGLESWLNPVDQQDLQRGARLASPNRPDSVAPLSMVSVRPPAPGKPGTYPYARVAELEILKGQPFVNGRHLPLERLKSYLDDKAAKREIEIVIIFPERDAKIGELFPIIDVCRSSSVRKVFLNSWGPFDRP